MEEFESARIDLVKARDLCKRIDCFKSRAKDLVDFIQSVKWGRHHINIDRSADQRPRIEGTLPDEFVLESLYRRFRFFILSKDHSNYRKLLDLLSLHTDSELLRMYCQMAQREFLKEDILSFAYITARKPVCPEEVIDNWFNAHYFHSDTDKRKKLKEFQNVVSDNGAKVTLWNTVWQASLRVRNLAWLLRDTATGRPEVYVPIVCIVRQY